MSLALVGYELCLGSCGLCDNGSVIILTTAVHRPPHLGRINSHSRNVCRCATTSPNSLETSVILHDTEYSPLFKTIYSLARTRRRWWNSIKPQTHIHSLINITFNFSSFFYLMKRPVGNVCGKCEWTDTVILCLELQNVPGMESIR